MNPAEVRYGYGAILMGRCAGNGQFLSTLLLGAAVAT
jgi:hypothetical protein